MRSPRAAVGVAFALDAEFAPWRTRRTFVTSGAEGRFETTIGSLSVRAAIVGIGARRLARVAPWLLDSSVDAVIVAGLAGALSSVHRVGDVLVGRQVCRDNEGRTADPHLLALAASCGAVVVDRLVTCDSVASTATKRTLAAAGDAVDMESFDVVDAAQRRGIAALALRVIGDDVDDDLPMHFEHAITPDGSLSALEIARCSLARPWLWPRLIRFAADQRRALAALSIVLDSLTASFGGLS